MRAVNLLPEQHRTRVSGGPRNGAYVVVGVLAVAVVMATLYALTANQVNSRKTEEAKVSQEAQTLEEQTATLGRFGDLSQIKQTRLASVRQLAGGRFDWERFMRELSLVLPSGSWIKEVDASASGNPEESGNATSAASGQPSTKLSGCTPKQPETAKLMVRLRRMHRVEDVTLESSSQEASGGSATLENCGKLYAFDLTVSFLAGSPPEGSASQKRVPASLGGGQ